MKQTAKKLLSLFLILFMILGLFISAREVKAEGKTQKIRFCWHVKGNRGYYNPADEGKDVMLPYSLYFEGKDANGNLVKDLYSEWKQYEGKVGETQDIEVPVDEIKALNGNTYTDCIVREIYVPAYVADRVYSGSIQGNYQDGDVATWTFSQAMQTRTNLSIQADSIILDSDKDNLLVSYKLAQIKDDQETYPYSSKSGLVECQENFEEGPLNLLKSDGFRLALGGSALEMFSAYSDVDAAKYIEYQLRAEFAGEKKADLDKRYKLSVSGNDLDGWQVELSSKIKEGEKVEKKEIPFNTVYEDDPTMLIGEEQVKQEGKAGKAITKQAYYYILNENGGEEILQEFDPVTETTKPLDKIILIGTKKQTVILTFDLNGGQKGGSKENFTIEAEVGSKITIPDAPTKAGYVFDYWQGSKYYPGDQYLVEAPHTFKAVWKEKTTTEQITTTTKAGNKLPKTGMDQSFNVYALTLSIAGLALAAISIRKKQKNMND